jgi:hypothetical protein
VWGTDGKPVEISEKLVIEQDLANRLSAGMSYFVYDVMPVDVYTEIQIEVETGFVDSSVFSDVQDVVDQYFSPENYPSWEKNIYKNEVVAVASRVPGVRKVIEVAMFVPSYGGGTISKTTNSDFYSNGSMATATIPSGQVVAPVLTTVHAGTMPRFTTIATTATVPTT